jgi:predicted nucleic acid-binding Zn ribbon protein
LAPGPRDLGRIFDDLLQRSGVKGRSRAFEEVRRAWVAVAGPELASHTRVRSLMNGILTVEVDSGPLCHRMASFQREELLGALQERVAQIDIRDLHFRLGALG